MFVIYKCYLYIKFIYIFYKNIVINRTNDNSKFATCGGDKAVFLWDVMSGRTIRRFQGHYQVIIRCQDRI